MSNSEKGKLLGLRPKEEIASKDEMEIRSNVVRKRGCEKEETKIKFQNGKVVEASVLKSTQKALQRTKNVEHERV